MRIRVIDGRRASVAAMVSLLLASGACAARVDGNGARATTRAEQPRTATELASILMSVPTGATESTTEFDRDKTPTFDQFSRGYYGTPDSGHLHQLGVTEVVHEGWIANDANAAEVVLFLFTDATAATAWMSDEIAALEDAGALPASLPGLPTVNGCMFTQYAGGGSQDRRYYSVVGRVGMTFNFYTPPSFGFGQAPQWVRAQVDQL